MVDFQALKLTYDALPAAARAACAKVGAAVFGKVADSAWKAVAQKTPGAVFAGIYRQWRDDLPEAEGGDEKLAAAFEDFFCSRKPRGHLEAAAANLWAVRVQERACGLRCECCAGVRSTMIRGICVPPTAMGTSRTTGTTALVFVASGMWRGGAQSLPQRDPRWSRPPRECVLHFRTARLASEGQPSSPNIKTAPVS
jgi:hypothetical protein